MWVIAGDLLLVGIGLCLGMVWESTRRDREPAGCSGAWPDGIEGVDLGKVGGE